jgi:hypothetical protein
MRIAAAIVLLLAAAAGCSPAPALIVSLLLSDRPIHARDAGIKVRADTELKESGMHPFRLARILVGPLES